MEVTNRDNKGNVRYSEGGGGGGSGNQAKRERKIERERDEDTLSKID